MDFGCDSYLITIFVFFVPVNPQFMPYLGHGKWISGHEKTKIVHRTNRTQNPISDYEPPVFPGCVTVTDPLRTTLREIGA